MTVTLFQRVGLGPQIRFAYYTVSRDNVDYSLAAFGIGPVLGVNFPMGPVATISLSGGFRLMGYAGTRDYDCHNYYDDDYYDNNTDFTVSGGMGFFNVSVLFGR